MNKIKFQDGTLIETSSILVYDELMRNHMRSVVTITTVGIDYVQASKLFVDGAEWSIIEMTEQGEQEYDWSDYGVAGPITDNRDGTLIIKMGKNNTVEQDLQDEVKTVTERADKASKDTVTLAGRPVEGSDDVSALRITFEQAAAKLSDSDATIAPSLSEVWNPFMDVTSGERRYYAPNRKLYKCLKDHKTDFTNAPDVSLDYWLALN